MVGIEAQILVDHFDNGTENDWTDDSTQYSVIPHDGSEPMSFILGNDGSIRVMDQNNGEYFKVEGTEAPGSDLVQYPAFNAEGSFYDPETGVQISLEKNNVGLTEINIHVPGQKSISVVPEGNLGMIKTDESPSAGSEGQSVLIAPMDAPSV